MKLNVSSDFIDSGNLQRTGEFTIRQSPLAFQILSSSLYSDKIAAVIRELACNAADAHVAIGKPDLPFIVKLPDNLDREFFIKDFGPGLTDEEVCDPVNGLYTTYFSSSKNTSNDVTGAFGLGSKSPFAYTDQFTITTARDGQTRTYIAYKGPGGVLRCDLVNTSPSSDDWPHGLKVSMPVAPQDFNEFRYKARSVLGWFTTLPTVMGASVEHCGVQQNHQIFQYESSGLNYPVVVMGNVAYRIDNNLLENHRLFSNADDKQILFTAWYADWVIRAPIGSVDITPSRESLEYTDKTVNYLIDALREYAHRIRSTFRAAVDATDKTFPALANLCFDPFRKQKIKFNSNMQTLIESGNQDIKHLLPLIFKNHITLDDLLPNDNINCFHDSSYGRAYWWRGTRFVSQNLNLKQQQCQPQTKFAVNDLPDGKIDTKLLKHHFPANNLPDYLIVLTSESYAAFKDFLLIDDCVVFLSTLPPVPKAPRAAHVRTPGVQPVQRKPKHFTVYDFTSDLPIDLPLKEIPDTARFFATRRSKNRQDVLTSVLNDKISFNDITPYNLKQSIRDVAIEFPSLTGLPTGVVCCAPNQEERLLKNGFAPLHSIIEPVVQAIVSEYTSLSSNIKNSSCFKEQWLCFFSTDCRPCRSIAGDNYLNFIKQVLAIPELTNFLLENSPNSPQRQLLEEFRNQHTSYLTECETQFDRLEKLYLLARCFNPRSLHPSIKSLKSDYSDSFLDARAKQEVICQLDALAQANPLQWPKSASKVIRKAGWGAASEYLLALFTTTEQENNS